MFALDTVACVFSELVCFINKLSMLSVPRTAPFLLYYLQKQTKTY